MSEPLTVHRSLAGLSLYLGRRRVALLEALSDDIEPSPEERWVAHLLAAAPVLEEAVREAVGMLEAHEQSYPHNAGPCGVCVALKYLTEALSLIPPPEASAP
jgi:hypothetical protein